MREFLVAFLFDSTTEGVAHAAGTCMPLVLARSEAHVSLENLERLATIFSVGNLEGEPLVELAPRPRFVLPLLPEGTEASFAVRSTGLAARTLEPLVVALGSFDAPFALCVDF